MSSTSHAAGCGLVGDGDGVVELGGRELVEVVGDVEVGGPAVGAERCGLGGERVGDAGDVGPAGELGAGLLDGRCVLGVVESAVVGVEHDAGGLPALAREPVVEDVGGVLGLDAGDAFAVVELAAGAALQGHDGDGGHEPQAQHPERVPGAGATEAVQECAHGILLEWWSRDLRDDCSIRERADLRPRRR